jgi:hypothetical protein
MTQRYSVSGTPDMNPDCTTADTGPPAGTHNEQPYWTWESGGITWFLSFAGVFWNPPMKWTIARFLGATTPAFVGSTDTSVILGDYPAVGEFVGTATVAEYEEPPAPEPEKLLVLEWLAGPHAGKYTLLKESL